MPEVIPTSHQPPEDRFLAWVDALVDPVASIPVPDPDLADLAGTAAFVQRVAGPASARSLALDRAESMWEEIMQALNTPATPIPSPRSSTGTSTIAQRTIPSVPAPGWRAWLPTALLIATLIAAGVGIAWRIAGPFDLGGDGTGERHPEFAVIATPGTPSVLEAQAFPSPASPVATSASPVAKAVSCDLSGDIPVVTNSSLALPGTVLRLEDDTLALDCNGQSTIVAEGVTGVVASTTWPGAILVQMDDRSLRGINLLTGAVGDLGTFAEIQQWVPYVRVTRWIVVPTTPDMLDWRIVDLETMDSFLLSDELGGVLPRSTMAHLYATTPDAAVIAFGGTPVIPGQVPSSPLDRGGATPPPGMQIASLPSEWAALVIDGSLDHRRWLEVPFASYVPAAISPDGELLAIEQESGDGRSVRVERLSDGALVAETGIEYGGGDSMVVLDGGAGLLHLAQDRLDRVTWDAEGDVTVDTLITVDTPADVPVLLQTTDPDVVIAGASAPSGGSTGYLVDVGSGEITEMPGMLQAPFYRAEYNDGVPVGDVLAAVPASDPEQSVLELVDVTTGQAVATSEPLDVAPTDLAMQPAALRDRGAIGFVFLADGRTVVLEGARGKAFIVEPPGDERGAGWYVTPSPGGDAIVAWSESSVGVYVRATTPDAQWAEVPAGRLVSFVAGAGDRSDAAG